MQPKISITKDCKKLNSLGRDMGSLRNKLYLRRTSLHMHGLTKCSEYGTEGKNWIETVPVYIIRNSLYWYISHTSLLLKKKTIWRILYTIFVPSTL